MRQEGAPSRFGIAAEIEDLDGKPRTEADALLRARGPVRVSATAYGYTHYIFSDTSEIWIRGDGEVVRLPRREYNPNGSRSNAGTRYDPYTGRVVRDNEAKHGFGERVVNEP